MSNLKHQLFLYTYNKPDLISSYLTDCFQICLLTSLKSRISRLFPLEFTETERGLVTKGTSYSSEIIPFSKRSLIAARTNSSSCKAELLFLANLPCGKE